MHVPRMARTALVTTAATLALATTAFASGGATSGGVNAGGVNSGGVTAGGSTSGGGKAACTVGTLSNAVGYYSSFAAIWTSWSSTNCPNGASWRMTFTNDVTGSVDYTSGGTLSRGAGSGTVDEDWASFSTPYTVTMTVSDSVGPVLTTRSAAATTPDAKTGP